MDAAVDERACSDLVSASYLGFGLGTFGLHFIVCPDVLCRIHDMRK